MIPHQLILPIKLVLNAAIALSATELIMISIFAMYIGERGAITEEKSLFFSINKIIYGQSSLAAIVLATYMARGLPLCEIFVTDVLMAAFLGGGGYMYSARKGNEYDHRDKLKKKMIWMASAALWASVVLALIPVDA